MEPQPNNNLLRENNLNNSQVNDILLQKPKRGQAYLFVLIFILVLTGIFGVWYFSQSLSNENIENVIVYDQSSDWGIYTNPQYGFELHYPKTWLFKETDLNNTLYKTISFEAVTKDPDLIKSGLYTAPVFQIWVYTIKQYTDSKKQCGQSLKDGSESSYCLQILNTLKKSSKYVFVNYNPAGGGLNLNPSDFDYSLYQKGQRSANTFKFISISTPIISTSNTSNSGIQGLVTIGPTCPVVRMPPDPKCADKPFSAGFNIVNLSGQIVKSFISDAKGKFSVSLLPGEYVLANIPAPGSYPRFSQQNINVPRDKYLEINLQLDSGIR